jgi:hypothetical protein
MSTASQRTIQALEQVVKDVPVGTNLALVHLLWAMVSGAFLHSRGAVFGALQWSGFSPCQIRRSWQALWQGSWRMEQLIESWRAYVLSRTAWQARSYEGYTPQSIDVTAFWRPRLQGWRGKFFYRLANRAIKGVGLALIAQVGNLGGQRIPLLQHMICAEQGVSDQALKQQALQWASNHLGEHEVAIHDAGASVADMQQAHIKRYVVRTDLNCSARRDYLPARKPQGRPPEYGQKVRPLPRHWKNRTIAATKPDFTTNFPFDGRTVGVKGWRNLVRIDQKVADDNQTFAILVFSDPLYRKPLVLSTNIVAQPQSIFCLYLDRWPVEQIPLAAKQMLGLHRQFVSAEVSCLRLPALALLAGNILTFLAAALPALPTGFWDRQPKKTPGRLRRVLAQTDFSKEYACAGQLRKKESVTDHLPKGVQAHRRHKAILLPI